MCLAMLLSLAGEGIIIAEAHYGASRHVGNIPPPMYGRHEDERDFRADICRRGCNCESVRWAGIAQDRTAHCIQIPRHDCDDYHGGMGFPQYLCESTQHMNQPCDKNPKRNFPVDSGLPRSYMNAWLRVGPGPGPVLIWAESGQQEHCNGCQYYFHAIPYHTAQMVDSHC